MGGYAFANEHIVEDSLAKKEVAVVSVRSAKAAAEIVRLRHRAIPGIHTLEAANLGSQECMQPTHAQPLSALVVVLVIFADMKEGITVVEDTNSDHWTDHG